MGKNIAGRLVPVIYIGGEVGGDFSGFIGGTRQGTLSKTLWFHSAFQKMVLANSFLSSPIIICSDDDVLRVREQLHEIGISARKIITEPVQKGISFAAALAAFHLKADDALICFITKPVRLSPNLPDAILKDTASDKDIVSYDSLIVMRPCVYLSALRDYSGACFKIAERSFYLAQETCDVIRPSADVFEGIESLEQDCSVIDHLVKIKKTV